MIKKLKSILITISMLGCAGLMAGCGSSASKSAMSSDSVMQTKGATSGYVNYDNSLSGAAYDDSAEYAAEESYDEAYNDTEPVEAEASGDASDKEQKNNKIDVEKLIYKCYINLETLQFTDTVSEFQKLITKYDGFVESEDTQFQNDYGYGDAGRGYYTATVRVPSDNYNAFINETDGIGTLKGKSQNVTNVSQEYSDLSIELEVLEAQKSDYMEMLKEAKSLEDMDNVILISDKIASVSTQINQIKTRMNSIDNDVAYSYVYVTIQEVKEIVEHTEETFAERFMKEVKQGWYDFGYGLQNFIIWIVANIWGLLIFFGIVFIIILIIRKIIKKIKKNIEKKNEMRMAGLQGMPPMPPQPSIYAQVNSGVPGAQNNQAAPQGVQEQKQINGQSQPPQSGQNPAGTQDQATKNEPDNSKNRKKNK